MTGKIPNLFPDCKWCNSFGQHTRAGGCTLAAYCVEDGCRRLATRRNWTGMVDNMPLFELVCEHHWIERDADG